MNILILSVGTRCKLINYFKLTENGFDKVVATDCSIYAPALYMADIHYIVPKMTDKKYLPVLMDICKKENINVILPLQEDELDLMADHKMLFEKLGIMVVISDLKTVKVCKDKYLMYRMLANAEINCVETYDYDKEFDSIRKLQLPIMLKEREGAGSIGNLKVENWPLLICFAANTDERLIVQPYMDAEEFGLDVYVDILSGEVVSIFAKEKIRMRAGETEKSKSFKDGKLFELVKRTTKVMKFRGPIDMDVFKYDGEYFILEINPRFGGGYPHAYECGENFIKYISINARGEKIKPNIGNYDENKILLKYMDVMMKDEKDMF